MRRQTLALSSALAAIGLSAAIVPAQQSSTPRSPVASSSAEQADPMLASKATRYLLRNGIDYLAYREYARALSFFRAVEARQNELTPAELDSLKKGIARAQQGIREAVNTPRVVSQPVKGRANVQPGAFALARPSTPEPVRLASAELPAPPPIQPLASVEEPAPIAEPSASEPPVTQPTGLELPSLPARMNLTPAPEPAAEPAPEIEPAAEPAPAPVMEPVADPAPAPALKPAAEPAPIPALEPAADPAPAPALDSPEVVPTGLAAEPPPPLGLELPGESASEPIELPAETPDVPPTDPAPIALPDEAPIPVAEPSTSAIDLPPSQDSPSPLPVEPLPGLPGVAEPAPVVESPPRVAMAPEQEEPSPPVPMPAEPISSPEAVSPAPEPPPAPEAPPAPEGNALPPLPNEAPSIAPATRSDVQMNVTPRLRRELDRIAQLPSETDRPGEGAAAPDDPYAAPTPSQGSTRLELPRPPSPTEARPLRRIPVPEEFVPLGAREWNPNRKYWSAAGTCHMTLYFQDPVLERYGQGVEQSLGPIGRLFSYPLDDPRQSNQRNQILQPFYSIGKFCFQVGTLPYKVLMDPPNEAEYDLGYYRPGDPIPPDTIYITPTGVGPPLHGRHY